MLYACVVAQLVVLGAAPAASPASGGFAHLVEIRIGGAPVMAVPRSAQVVAPPARMRNEVEGGVEPQVAQLRLEDGTTLLVGFSHGHREDPSFALLVRKASGAERLEVVAGTRLHLTEDGTVYVSGHTDDNFDQRRKLVLREGALHEVAQPFLLVDQPCATTAPAVLRSEPGGRGTVVAEVPAGGQVRVLLSAPPAGEEEGAQAAEGRRLPYVLQPPDDYLVATPFGLVGWVRQVQYGQTSAGSSPLGCLTYAGD